MNRVCSVFSQLLEFSPRLEFEQLVQKHRAERHAPGFPFQVPERLRESEIESRGVMAITSNSAPRSASRQGSVTGSKAPPFHFLRGRASNNLALHQAFMHHFRCFRNLVGVAWV